MALNIPWDLFRKLLENSITAEEKKELFSWKDKSALNQYIYDEVLDDKQIHQILLGEKPINETQQWEKLLKRIEPQVRNFVIRRNTFYWASSAAAIALLVIGLLAGFLLQNKKKVPDSQAYTYVFSPRGQRTHMILPDKSKVWLNSESSIRYTVDFNNTVREVYMEGEAYFQVAKNPEKPFIVKTSDLKIKVYGTSFNVKAYPGEKTIETTLIEGKLSVTPINYIVKGNKEIYLKPKDRLTYTKSGAVCELNGADKEVKEKETVKPDHQPALPVLALSKNVDSRIEQSWKDGTLLFKDEMFGDLAVKLERWYDIKIHFNDEKIKSYRFTGKFDKETINEAMEALRASSEESYRYEIVFRDVYLKSK